MPRSRKHYRLKLADALGAHERAIAFGGLPGILNLGGIESAIARPYAGYNRRIHEKAAASVESMTKNHGFIDGNKRTTFILLNLTEPQPLRTCRAPRRRGHRLGP